VKLYIDTDLRPPHEDLAVVVSFHPERFENVRMKKRRKLVLP
jgi:hypothetical protein